MSTKDGVIKARAEQFDASLAVARARTEIEQCTDALSLARANYDRALMALRTASDGADRTQAEAIAALLLADVKADQPISEAPVADAGIAASEVRS